MATRTLERFYRKQLRASSLEIEKLTPRITKAMERLGRLQQEAQIYAERLEEAQKALRDSAEEQKIIPFPQSAHTDSSSPDSDQN